MKTQRTQRLQRKTKKLNQIGHRFSQMHTDNNLILNPKNLCLSVSKFSLFFYFFFLCSLWLIIFVSFSGTAFSAPPERIVSLAPSITEILYAMGLEDRIAAVTNFCDYPPQAKKKPKIGGMSNPSLEAVLSMKPDIVVMTTDGNPKEVEERLRQLGIKTYVFRARQLAELPDGIRELGIALGVKEKAYKIAGEIETEIQEARGKGQGARGKGKTIFIVWPEPLIVAGPGTAIDDTLQLLGWENIASDTGVKYPKYSVEEVIRRSPDIILIGKSMGADMKESSKGLLEKLGMLEAVKKGNVYYTSDTLYRLGPRIVEGIEEIAGYLKQNHHDPSPHPLP